MTLSDANSWAGIIGLVVAVASLGFVVWDSIKRRRKLRLDEQNIVTTNAIQLMEQLRKQHDDLEEQLAAANKHALDLQDKLRDANDRADALQRQHDQVSEQLTHAQAEVRILRGQVKYLSTELEKYNPTT